MKYLVLLFLITGCFAAPGGPGVAITQVRTIYSSTNVTTSAWVEIVASTLNPTSIIQIFDSSGQTLQLGVGAVGSEVPLMIIPPGGIENSNIYIPPRSRISLKALSGTANVGENDVSLFY